MSDEQFETMISDFQKTIQDGRFNPSELASLESTAMLDGAYLDNRHFQHQERKAQVEALRREQARVGEPRERERTARELREMDFTDDLRIDASTDAGRYRRSQLLRLYGPRPGQDTPTYRESLTPGLRRLIEEEHGPTPKDADPDPLTRKRR
jgi:hypothetical protein